MTEIELGAHLNQKAYEWDLDMAQVEADAVEQARRTGLLGQPRRIIDHIRRAAKYDFDARPHGRLPGAGFEPIPWKHEALQHEVYELVGTVQRLRTVAEERLQWLEDRRQLDLEALGHIRQWALEEASTQAAEYRVAIAATEERYRRLGDAECACPTCAAITGGVWEVRRSLEAVDGTLRQIQVTCAREQMHIERLYRDAARAVPPAGHIPRQPAAAARPAGDRRRPEAAFAARHPAAVPPNQPPRQPQAPLPNAQAREPALQPGAAAEPARPLQDPRPRRQYRRGRHAHAQRRRRSPPAAPEPAPAAHINRPAPVQQPPPANAAELGQDGNEALLVVLMDKLEEVRRHIQVYRQILAAEPRGDQHRDHPQELVALVTQAIQLEAEINRIRPGAFPHLPDHNQPMAAGQQPQQDLNQQVDQQAESTSTEDTAYTAGSAPPASPPPGEPAQPHQHDRRDPPSAPASVVAEPPIAQAAPPVDQDPENADEELLETLQRRRDQLRVQIEAHIAAWPAPTPQDHEHRCRHLLDLGMEEGRVEQRIMTILEGPPLAQPDQEARPVLPRRQGLAVDGDLAALVDESHAIHLRLDQYRNALSAGPLAPHLPTLNECIELATQAGMMQARIAALTEDID